MNPAESVSNSAGAAPTPDLANATFPHASPGTESQEAALEEALDKISFDTLKHLFLKKLAAGVDQLLEQNTQVSIEKATELIKSIEILSDHSKGEIFFEVGQSAREKVEEVRVQGCELVDGRINGRGYSKGRYLPVINGKFIYEIEGKEIADCDRIHNVDFKLNGMVKIGNGPLLPVINGNVIETVEGHKIGGSKYITNVGGELNGCVLIGKRFLPVLAGKIIREIDGHQITDFEDFENIGGKLNGRLSTAGPSGSPHYFPVIDGKVITEISEEKILDSKNVRNTGGALTAEVQFANYSDTWYPIKNGYLKPIRQYRY